MAAGKQDSRQKMINMMYLVFIAMLALNISKEVLATLGILNEDIRVDRKKVGFNSSIDSILNIENKRTKDFLFDKKSEIYDLVNRNKIIQLFQIKSKPNYISKFIFNFINAKIFLDMENKTYVSN